MRRLKIAVTGTRGLLGSRLLARLASDETCRRIVALDLLPPPTPLDKARFYRVDFTDPIASTRIAEALERERVDVVVHLAFLQHPVRTAAYEHELEVLGTLQLFHAIRRIAREAPPPHVVVASSTLVYGARSTNPSFLDEESPLAAARDYAFVADKIEAERELVTFQAQTGVAATVLRFAPLLAVDSPTLAARYFSLSAVPTILGFNPMIQMLAVDDALAALSLAVQRGATIGGRGSRDVFNVAPSGVMPLHAAIRLCGRRAVPLVRFAANGMVDALFQAGLAMAPSAQLDYLQHPCVADGARAARELGFTPRFSTRECIADFARTLFRDAA
jgi:UDP-glucose 4-epimerase